MHDPHKWDNVGKGNEQAFQWYRIQCYDKDNNDKRQQRYDYLHAKFRNFFGKLRYGQSQAKNVSVLLKAEIINGWQWIECQYRTGVTVRKWIISWICTFSCFVKNFQLTVEIFCPQYSFFNLFFYLLNSLNFNSSAGSFEWKVQNLVNAPCWAQNSRQISWETSCCT